MKNIIKTLLVVMTLALVLVAFTACDLTAFFGCQHEGGTATCTELAICDKCGEAYGDYGHVAIKLPATPATCSKPGMSSGSYCKNCDAVIVEQKETPKLDHEWVPNEFKDKTCSTDGVEGGNHCANCGIRDENTKVLEASHEFGEYYVALEPTCGEDGYYARKCEDCGTVERGDDIPATGEHSFTVDVPEKAPTCAEAGHTACKACEVCGAPNEDYAEIPATEDHEFNPDEIFVAVPPTETEHGMTAGYCTKCGNGYYLDYVHVYENGACKICGAADPSAPAPAVTTASKSIADLIVSEGWTNSTTSQTFKLDDVVTVQIKGGSNSGKAYDGNHIRIYATDTPAGSMTISVAEGYELVSIKITTSEGTYAFLCVEGTETDISNTVVEVSGSSVVLNTIKNGSDGKQVRVLAIEVVYQTVAE